MKYRVYGGRILPDRDVTGGRVVSIDLGVGNQSLPLDAFLENHGWRLVTLIPGDRTSGDARSCVLVIDQEPDAPTPATGAGS